MKYLLLLLAVVYMIQDKPKPKSDTPLAPVEFRMVILKEQLAEARIQSELQACQARKWGDEYNAHQAKLQEAIDAAFKGAGLTTKDYDLNLETFEFVKRATPTQATEPNKKP